MGRREQKSRARSGQLQTGGPGRVWVSQVPDILWDFAIWRASIVNKPLNQFLPILSETPGKETVKAERDDANAR